MKQIHVSAPGKIILLGEHVVVYNKPAIIASVAKRCHVTLVPRKDKFVKIVSEHFNLSETLTEETILRKTKLAREKWDEFSKSNNIDLLKSITTNPLDYPTIALGEALLHYKKEIPNGFTLTVQSEVPIGSGMGSSASLAVSIAGAVSLLLGEPLVKEIINTIAFASEQKKHGFPSGGDNSACCYGGMVWYRRETPEFKIIQQVPFPLSQNVAKNFLTVFTGIPNESTGEMVSNVRALYNANKAETEEIFSHQENLVRSLLTAIKQEDHDAIIAIIRDGEHNLKKLGVVSPPVSNLIKTIERAGGAAKICGGGGKTQGTGTLLIYHKDKKIIANLLKKQKLTYSEITLAVEGVREEKN